MHRLIPTLLVLLPLVAAGADAKVLPAGTIVHDLRDLLPFANAADDQPDKPFHAFSVTTGYFTGYRAEDSDGDGYLSHADIARIVVKLQATLREQYPEVYAAVDVDGDEKLTHAEILAYMGRKP